MASTSSGPMGCPFHGPTFMELMEYWKPYKCDGCDKEGYGPRYRCNHCDYELHSECMYPSHKFILGFLPGHVFEFKEHPPPSPCCNPKCTDPHTRYCDVCATAVNGFVYHCSKTGFDLHPRCAMLNREIVIEGVNIRLETNNRAGKTKMKKNKCDWCDARKVEGSVSGIRGWSYVSSDYNYHVACIMDMTVQSWKSNLPNTTTTSVSLAMVKSDLPSSIVKKKKNGVSGSSKYWRILRMLITTIMTMVFGDPTMLNLHWAYTGPSVEKKKTAHKPRWGSNLKPIGNRWSNPLGLYVDLLSPIPPMWDFPLQHPTARKDPFWAEAWTNQSLHRLSHERGPNRGTPTGQNLRSDTMLNLHWAYTGPSVEKKKTAHKPRWGSNLKPIGNRWSNPLGLYVDLLSPIPSMWDFPLQQTTILAKVAVETVIQLLSS